MIDFNTLLEQEEGLDPQNWQESRALAHRMVDDMFTYLETIAERPVWVKPTNESLEQLTSQMLPQHPQPTNEIYETFRQHILPYPKGNIHPRFWSWVQGTGTPLAMMADMLASGMNSNVAIGDHSAMYVEQQVIDWCKTMFGYPATGSGILLSGGSMANITGLLIARNAHADLQVRHKGLYDQEAQLLLYCSTETHSCVQKAAEVIGLGSDAIRRIPVDENYRMQVLALQKQLKEDRENGFSPFCVVGNAGTVNTGAIDPLQELLDVCRKEGLWFHVDGAFGSLAKLVPEFQEQLRAIEEADSLAFDLHKWMYMPYELGCLLVRNKEAHRAAFALQPNYLLSHERGLAAGPDPIGNYGMELSRGFKALKAWMSLKEHGVEKYSRLIAQNIAQAFYLGSLVEAHPELELLTPVTLNIVCFRYRVAGVNGVPLNDLNKEILMELHVRGLSAPSYTFLEGRYAIRVANVNHRSRKADFEALVQDVVMLGRELVEK